MELFGRYRQLRNDRLARSPSPAADRATNPRSAPFRCRWLLLPARSMAPELVAVQDVLRSLQPIRSRGSETPAAGGTIAAQNHSRLAPGTKAPRQSLARRSVAAETDRVRPFPSAPVCLRRAASRARPPEP